MNLRSKRSWIRFVNATFILALVACSNTASSGGPEGVAVGVTSHPTIAATATGGSTAPRPSRTTPVGTRSAAPATPLRVEGIPACVERGNQYQVRYYSEPNAVIAGAATYSNGGQYGSSFAGQADGKGTHTYNWLVPTSAPTGRATFKAGAQAPNETATNVTFSFVVREIGQC